MEQHTFEKSSFLAGVSYDPETEVMTVLFTNGKEYTFAEVPKEVYEKFISTDSAGSYFGQNIKGKYQAPEKE